MRNRPTEFAAFQVVAVLLDLRTHLFKVGKTRQSDSAVGSRGKSEMLTRVADSNQCRRHFRDNDDRASAVALEESGAYY